jgi:hypothetical protein
MIPSEVTVSNIPVLNNKIDIVTQKGLNDNDHIAAYHPELDLNPAANPSL